MKEIKTRMSIFKKKRNKTESRNVETCRIGKAGCFQRPKHKKLDSKKGRSSRSSQVNICGIPNPSRLRVIAIKLRQRENDVDEEAEKQGGHENCLRKSSGHT